MITGIRNKGLAVILTIAMIFAFMPATAFAAGEPAAPELSGSISKSVSMGEKVEFAAKDFTGRYIQNDGKPLERIMIKAKNSKADGKFTTGGSTYIQGAEITTDDMGSLIYTPASLGTKEFIVTFYETGNSVAVGTVELTIEVESKSLATVEISSAQGQSQKFPASDVSTKFKSASGLSEDFSKIEFKSLPSSSEGVIYKGYTSQSSKGTAIDAKTEYLKSELDKCYFVPASDFVGSSIVEFTVYDSEGTGYDGKVIFRVESTKLAAINDTVSLDETYKIPYSEMNSKVKSMDGTNGIMYVQFTNAGDLSKYGSLYYNGEKTTSSTAKYYYTGSSSKNYLSKVTFVPTASGTVSLEYTAYVDENTHYEGVIKLTVEGAESELDTITYKLKNSGYVNFALTDFTSVTPNLEYVKFNFEDISSSKGTFYYDYDSDAAKGDAVSSSTRYYKKASSGEKSIASVSFVPKAGVTGTFYLSYTARDTGGTTYTGEVKLIVGDASELKDISYTTDKNKAVEFNVEDFKKVFEKVSDNSLSYVYFELPAASKGKLYYNYKADGEYDSAVSDMTKYYRSGTSKALIDKVSFVPKDGFEGTVSIRYEAFDAEDSYEGVIKIKVGTGSSYEGTLNSIAVTTTKDKAVAIPESSIRSAFKSEAGCDYSYIQFDLPLATYGALYYNYKSDENKGTAVAALSKYYINGTVTPAMITLVPAAGYTGNFELKYTAVDADGNTYKGVLKFTVSESEKPAEDPSDDPSEIPVNEDGSSVYFVDVTKDYAWASQKIDYLYKKNIVKGTWEAADSIFYSPGEKITRGDFVLMLYRAFGLEGKVSFTENFSDVPKDSYYYDAIGTAKMLGIAQGAYGLFNPTDSLTREDAMVLIYRTIQITGAKKITTSSDITMFGDKFYIDAYAQYAVGSLVKSKVINGYADGNFGPLALLTRAEMAVVLYNVEQLADGE